MSPVDISTDGAAFELSTDRLLLRPPRSSDAAALFGLMRDPRLSEFLAWAPHQSVAETSAMIATLLAAEQARSGFHWAVTLAGEVVGLVSLIDVRWTHRTWRLNRAELAYWIGTEFQGNGFATEAARAVIQFGFEPLQLTKIRVYHARGNAASASTVRRLDFRLVGVEESAFEKNGVFHDLVHYERLSSRIGRATASVGSAN
jgi:ribosomal-protein-alanine N-acetyltransferase